MLAVSHRSFEALSTSHAGLAMEDSGTINPAALNAPGKHLSALDSPPCDASRRAFVLAFDDTASAWLNMPPSQFIVADSSHLHLANTISPNLLSTSSPRGQKRSRTPDSYNTTSVKTEGGTLRIRYIICSAHYMLHKEKPR